MIVPSISFTSLPEIHGRGTVELNDFISHNSTSPAGVNIAVMDSNNRSNAASPFRAKSVDETSLVDSLRDYKSAPRDGNSSSSLLHSLLSEKKAENRRMSRMSELEYDDTIKASKPREIQSSPLGPIAAGAEYTRNSRRVSGIGARSVSVPKVMGFREMEEVSAVYDTEY